MPGMGSGVQATNPTIVAAFHSALLRDLLIVLGLIAVLAAAWAVLSISALARAYRQPAAAEAPGETDSAPRGASGSAGAAPADPRSEASNGPAGRALEPDGWPPRAEPLARKLLRYSFAALWLLDGLLQLQSAMPLAMVSQVIDPTASASPAFVRTTVGFGATTWSDHPVEAAVAAVFIQVGLGLWLAVARRGRLSRLAGGASALWALLVWVFAESFGGIFVPGASFLFGLPGAALFYAVAGVLLALPERAFSPGLGRLLVRGLGVLLLGMAALEAWPGRGFWSNHDSVLARMVNAMSTLAQPSVLHSALRSFGSFADAHGTLVNLVAVVVLAALGMAFFSARAKVVRAAVPVTLVFFFAVWIFVQDCGFFGGVGTDPNSMLPLLFITVSAEIALLGAAAPVGSADAVVGGRPAALGTRTGLAGGVGRIVLGLAAVGVVAVGALPMAVASTNRTADPILAQALAGSTDWTVGPTPSFSLVDQNGRAVTLASLRGKAVLLTFLDPVCNFDCPLIAQYLKGVDAELGTTARHVELVAVVANPIYRAPVYMKAFDRQEGLTSLHNWLFLTGSLGQLRKAWGSFGVTVSVAPAGAMIAHTDILYVIDPLGRTREILSADPGPGTSAYESSFSSLLASAALRALHSA